MPEIKVHENEDVESALKRFKREIQKEGILKEIKKREFYEKPSERRKKKLQAAIRKEAQRLRRELSSPEK